MDVWNREVIKPQWLDEMRNDGEFWLCSFAISARQNRQARRHQEQEIFDPEKIHAPDYARPVSWASRKRIFYDMEINEVLSLKKRHLKT